MTDKNIHATIKRFWTGQHKAGHNGLVMLDQLMHHWANTNDWTPLGRFLCLAGKEKPALWAMVRVAFGPDRVKSKADKEKSEFGFKLERVGWKAGEFDLSTQNGYGTIRQAIEDKKSFRSADFQKAVREALGKPEKQSKDKSAIEAMELVYKYLTKKIEDDQNLKAELSEMVSMLEKRIEVRKAQVEPDH
jgi:hypothetical protein